ncbi:MAG: queuosine salvage family protein [Solirubrobacteraceae bacterium]
MTALPSELRTACARVARLARQVEIDLDAISGYAAALPLEASPPELDPQTHLIGGTRAELAAFWLTLDAINFGAGWFPTLRKREGRSGYFTIAIAIRERFARAGPWSAAELAEIDALEVARVLRQDPAHELMALFARSLRDLGARVQGECGGRFQEVVEPPSRSTAGSVPAQSAASLAMRLARWDCFADTSLYAESPVPFLKRAQLAAADLVRAGVADGQDLHGLTMFADNLVPHVLRLDGVLGFEPGLVQRIDRGELIEHGSPEEVEIRACAVHAVELIVAQRPGTCAADVDQLLWHRGRHPRYKASPRHRSRCTAY